MLGSSDGAMYGGSSFSNLYLYSPDAWAALISCTARPVSILRRDTLLLDTMAHQ